MNEKSRLVLSDSVSKQIGHMMISFRWLTLVLCFFVYQLCPQLGCKSVGLLVYGMTSIRIGSISTNQQKVMMSPCCLEEFVTYLSCPILTDASSTEGFEPGHFVLHVWLIQTNLREMNAGLC